MLIRLSLIVILACFSPFIGTAAPQLKVGVILPLSGSTAEYGTALKNGIDLAQSNFEKARNNIEFIYEDVEYSVPRAVAAFYKLVTQDKVALIYVWGVPFCEALAPLAEARKIALVGQCVNSTLTKDRKFVLRFMNHSEQYMKTFLEYAKTKSWKKVAVVYSENSYIVDLLKALQRVSEDGLEITIVDSYQPGQNDFRSTLAKLAPSKFDVLGVFLASGQIPNFYRQMRELNVNTPTFGTNFFDSIGEIKLAHGAMAGAIFSNNYFSSEFLASYENAFRNSSQVQWAALSYEFVHFLTLAQSRMGSYSANEVISALRTSTPEPTGAVGPFRFVQDDQAGDYFEFQLAMKMVEDKRTSFLVYYNR